MSLYANISVSNQEKSQQTPAKENAPTTKRQAKSAALYAAVLAKPPSHQPIAQPDISVPETVIQRSLVDVEPEKPSETAALQFKPAIKRLQKTVKTKPISLAPPTETPAAPIQNSGNRSSLQDISRIQEDIANDDVNGFYRTLEGQKLARKNARKKKRKNNDGQGTYIWTWDDDYDPLHPNDYETYVDSDEQLREQIEWQRKVEGRDESEEMEELDDTGYRGFAPPPEDEEEDDWVPPEDDEHEYVPEPVTEIALDESVDEVYARRMRMALEAGMKLRPATPLSAIETPKEEEEIDDDEDSEEEPKKKNGEPSEIIPSFYEDSPPPPPPPPPKPQPPPQPQFNFNTYNQPPSLYASAPGMQPSQPPPQTSSTISSEPIHYATATISSDPIYYSAPSTTTEPETSTEDLPRGSHPGQKGFAARLMSKYGWEKGQSLGSTSSAGLVTPLLMKVDKEKKGTGVIVNRNKTVEDHGPFGKMTRCIVLGNVVAPGEVDDELVEEIGEECRSKYGEVERVKVVEDRKQPADEAVRVFVLFTSELSALRGVNSLNSRLFGGRKIKARFFDVDKFEEGDFR